MVTYKDYLRFGKDVLVSFISTFNKMDEFKTAQAAASYLIHFHTEAQYTCLLKYAKQYMRINYSSINRRAQALSRDLYVSTSKSEGEWLDHYNQKQQRAENDLLQMLVDTYVDDDVNDQFVNQNVFTNKTDKCLSIRVVMDGSEEQAGSMVSFINNQVLKKMNFSDIMKIYYTLDDGSKHYDYINATNIKHLFTKFEDKNWNVVTDHIAPTEGSDNLIMHVDYKRIMDIEFKIWTPKPNRTYKTRGGSFFKYTVRSPVDLTDYQIIRELNKDTARLIDEHCLVYALE